MRAESTSQSAALGKRLRCVIAKSGARVKGRSQWKHTRVLPVQGTANLEVGGCDQDAEVLAWARTLGAVHERLAASSLEIVPLSVGLEKK